MLLYFSQRLLKVTKNQVKNYIGLLHLHWIFSCFYEVSNNIAMSLIFKLTFYLDIIHIILKYTFLKFTTQCF